MSWECVISGVDAYQRNVSKSFNLRGADYAAALANLTALLTDFLPVSGMRVVTTTLSEKVTRTDAATAGANRDEGATLTVLNSLGEKSTLKIPCPEEGYRNPDGTIDIEDAEVVAYFENFLSTGSAFIDRDLSAVELLSGKLDD